ncbi:MAG: 3-dehydroquinate synthase [Rhodospirillaceae bacterium]|nr:3-dehydroquinate synthase [Rhodospirillaceae bacterium]
MTISKDGLRLELGDRSYDIAVGEGMLAKAGAEIHSAAGSGKCWIVTDKTVAVTYLEPLERSLQAAGLVAETIVLPPGEASKNFATVEKVVNSVLDGAPERSSTMIALGGGVIGDLTGFAASIILRGINFVQIPTTLLAQVDSSVGGKTGINTRHGKNLAGAFYQPKLVIADTNVLETLPHRELLAGYAEIIKYGLIHDIGFFEWLEQNGAAVLDGDRDARAYAVSASCAAKAAIVAEDERENGLRALLNFGHTFGHALEAETGFGTELLHGEAVAIGMIMALELSAMLDLCAAADLDRVRRHYETTGLPMTVPKSQNRHWDPATLIQHMGHDKKVEDGKVTFILARAIGEAFVARDINLDEVKRLLDRAVAA